MAKTTNFPNGIKAPLYDSAGKKVVGDQQANITAAKVDYTTGDLDTEAETIAALNTTNGKINSILTALKAHGILASS